jgi:hypothetical protein
VGVAAGLAAQPQPVAIAGFPGLFASLQPAGRGMYHVSLVNSSPAPAEVSLNASDGDGSCTFRIPHRLSVPASGNATANLFVTARARRWGGQRLIRSFSVGIGGGGGPPTTLGGQFEDVPRGWLPIAGGLFAVGAAVVAAIVILNPFGGDDAPAGDDDETPTPTEETAATPTPTEKADSTPGSTSVSPTVPPAATATSRAPSPTSAPPTPTTRPPTATPTPRPPTPTPTPEGPPANSIVTGEWTYNWRVTLNNCDFGPDVGDTFEEYYLFAESTTDDDYISPGEHVDITWVTDGGDYDLGSWAFTYPRFTFTYDFTRDEYEGIATLASTFTSPNSGTATVTEEFVFSDGSQCRIVSTD